VSAALREIVNEHGVLLRYRTDLRGPHHDAQRAYPSDRLRMAILRSERELRAIETMLECLELGLSDVAVDRFAFALRTFSATFNMTRAELCKDNI
jgi:hypothetical protein